MEQLSEGNKLELAKNSLTSVLISRLQNYNYTVKGKDNGKNAWHQILVDWGKKDQFLEKTKTGSVDVAVYGRILASGWGHDIPQDRLDRVDKLIDDIWKCLIVLGLENNGYVETYYVLCKVGKELEIRSATSIEEIRHCGRILYFSRDEDPAEALACVIEAEYFGLDDRIIWNVDTSFDAVLNGTINVQGYLDEGNNVNSTDRRGWTMLHHFAQHGNMDIISLLKDRGADIQVQDRMCGRKPIHIAAREGQTEAIEFFLKNGAIVDEADKNNWTLLHYAAFKGNLKTVSLLFEKNAKLNAKDLTEGKKPIHVASEYGHTDVIEAFLKNGVSIEDEDNSGRTPLYYAAWRGHLKTTKFLIEKGANFYRRTTFGTMPIHAAASAKNNNQIIDLFLVLGINVDETDSNGQTPLHRAVFHSNLELVQFLIDKKANLNIADKNSKTPLDFSKENTDVFLYLVERMGTKFQDEEKYSDALRCYREMLEIQKEKFGPNHLETLKTLNQEAKVLFKQGQYNAAETSFKNVLEIRESSLSCNPIDTLDTKHGLGLVYDAQAKFGKAMEIYKEVFGKRETLLGAYHHDTLNVARDMAYVHFKKAEHDEAFKIFKDVFEKRKASFGENHRDTLQVQQDMAVVLVNKGNYKTALQTFKDVLQKRKNTLGDNHPDTLMTEHHLLIVSQKFETELKESNGTIEWMVNSIKQVFF